MSTFIQYRQDRAPFIRLIPNGTFQLRLDTSIRCCGESRSECELVENFISPELARKLIDSRIAFAEDEECYIALHPRCPACKQSLPKGV